MGIDIHGLNFMTHVASKRRFGHTLTLGRQKIYLDVATTAKLLGRQVSGKDDAYCEWLLKEKCGASSVESMDYSDYEDATYLQDMNKPVPESMHGRFDTVFDGGTLEHIYNVPQGLKNISDMCRVNGQIIHIVPANNMCGHGFWQFSPELFFSLYSEANGYSETEVYLADLSDNDRWFKVLRQREGTRLEFKSDYDLYVMVRTVLKTRDFSHERVQQSDYVHVWTQPDSESGTSTRGSTHNRMKETLSRFPLLFRILVTLYSPFKHLLYVAKDMGRMNIRRMIHPLERLDRKNPNIEIVPVSKQE
jgi:hypothetical protein